MSKEKEPMFKKIADLFWTEVPGLASLWFRPEADDIIDLRFELKDDSWSSRREAIDHILEIKSAVDEVFVNFSFVLPDEAYTISATEKMRYSVHSFV